MHVKLLIFLAYIVKFRVMKKRLISSSYFVACMLIFLLCQHSAASQETKQIKSYKNTIRFNITNPLIFGSGSLVLGYERVINKRQTFSINVGQASFPALKFIDSDSLQLVKSGKREGFNISADYRFYLAKENKYPAPRGIYIGPYYSYNHFGKKNSWSVKGNNGFNGIVDTKLSLDIHTVGFELGYQFVLWNRVALDFILLGPGVGFYNLKASIGDNLSEYDRQELLDRLNSALADKFPGYNVVINDVNFKTKGTARTTTLGYRYMVNVGFRF